MSYYAVTYSSSLSHHGIKGQKWGRRRYQYEDGSLTADGRRRYGFGERIRARAQYKIDKKAAKAARKARDNKAYKEVENAENSIEKRYRRGQNLSKKDLAREEAAYRKYDSALAKSKEQYQKDIHDAKANRYRPGKSKTDNYDARSKNPLLGRQINASYEDRVARGEKLRSQGRTKAGAIGRYIGRDILVGMAAAPLAGAATAHYLSTGNPIASHLLSGALGAYEVSSLIRTYQDIADMNTYDDSKRK